MGVACCKGPVIDDNAEVELSHFTLLRSIGKGAFGKVRVVQHKRTKKIYALKYINKEKCFQTSVIDNIIAERNLLEAINNNFCCNMRYSFQDDENMFMVIDLMLGGDLSFHLERIGTFTEEQIAHLVAELSCGLAYLHSKNIIHRDLKPANVLLDSEGHAHLADFNMALRFKHDKPITGVAGSMAYMAPEILRKKGYFASIDWWSLGVMTFEMATSKRPFRAKTNEGLQNAILHEEVPREPLSKLTPELNDFILRLLDRDVKRRIGVKEVGGLDSIKAHKFFRHINWPLLEQKKSTPLFVPDAKKANYDPTHELEELLLVDVPLKAKPRKKKVLQEQNREESPEERAYRIIEEEFLVYDYSKINHDTISMSSSDVVDIYENGEYIKPDTTSFLTEE
ncbi:hypothetical protein HDV06_005141 [Boothiomyces sp. JEL0866]|nr:hypothetical protein HDV06_005141 [Boothiomyces sp. JEL0866]